MAPTYVYCVWPLRSVKSNSPSGRTSSSSITPTSARSMGTNLTSGMASAASRDRTITHTSPGPASTTSAATCSGPFGSSFLLSGWTIRSFSPSVPVYLSVQTALPTTLPRIMWLLQPRALEHAFDDRVQQGRVDLGAQLGEQRAGDALAQIALRSRRG